MAEPLNKREISQVNRQCSVALLLKRYGIDVDSSSKSYCPFHKDDRKSAKYYEDGNSFYCFAESKQYRAYDILKELGFSDDDIRQHVDMTKIPERRKPREVKSIFKDKKRMEGFRVMLMSGKTDIVQFIKTLFTELERGEEDATT